MKKRRTAIVAFLLIAVLTITVGYAAINDTLYVNGTVKASVAEADEHFDVNVHFDAENAPSGEGYTVTIKDDDLGDVNDLAVVAITGLINMGDSITINIPIVNESQYDATLTLTATSYSTEHFDFTYSIPSTIEAANTVNVTITVELLETPTDADLTAGFSFDIDAVAVTE